MVVGLTGGGASAARGGGESVGELNYAMGGDFRGQLKRRRVGRGGSAAARAWQRQWRAVEVLGAGEAGVLLWGKGEQRGEVRRLAGKQMREGELGRRGW